MKVFTKEILQSVNTMASVMKYNRVTAPAFLETLPDDKLYAPRFELIHEHKAGVKCEPHVRCVFEHDDDWFIIDVEMGCYNLLPDSADVIADRLRRQEEEATAV